MTTPNAEILKRIEHLKPWISRHEVCPNVYTPAVNNCAASVQPEVDAMRAALILNAIAKADLRGASVLDLGCASGFFSFEFLRAGAATATGIDANDHHIRQAQFLADHYGFDLAASFTVGTVDATTIASVKKYDIVLLLDVLQYLSSPAEAFEAIAAATKRLVVVDAHLADAAPRLRHRPVSDGEWVLFQRARTRSHPKDGNSPFTVLPTFGALAGFLEAAGFDSVRRLEVPRSWRHPALPLGRYERGERTIVIAHRGPATEPTSIRGSDLDGMALGRVSTLAVVAGEVGRALLGIGARFTSWSRHRSRSRSASR